MVQLAGAVKKTPSFMQFLTGDIRGLTGLMRTLNPFDPGLTAVVNDSEGFEQVLTRFVSTTACVWNEMQRVASPLTRRIRNLTPFAPRSSRLGDDLTSVRRKLKGIR